MKDSSKKFRINLRVSEEELEAVDTLARMTGTTRTEALMTAVRIYKSIEEERKKSLILGTSTSDYDDYEYYEEDFVEDEGGTEGDELCY